MKTGLFFGSFNPVHIGHMALANYIVEYSDINEIWFVVSPHNPLKKKSSLLNDHTRLELVKTAIEDDTRFKACDIEFYMPQPSFTIDTLIRLNEKYPNRSFSLIMGSDGLKTFHKWKNAELISDNYERIVYPRPGDNMEELQKQHQVTFIDAPKIEISSTFIRNAIAQKKDVRHFLPSKVNEIVSKYGYYA